MPLVLSLSSDSVLVFLAGRQAAHLGIGGRPSAAPAWSAASSASKAALLTITAFFGNQAWVSYQYLTCS